MKVTGRMKARVKFGEKAKVKVVVVMAGVRVKVNYYVRQKTRQTSAMSTRRAATLPNMFVARMIGQNPTLTLSSSTSP